MKRILNAVAILGVLVIAGCTSTTNDPTPNVEETVSSAVEATLEALVSEIEATQVGRDGGPGATASPTIGQVSVTFEDFERSAERITYDDLFRNNEGHLGKRVYFRGEVTQVLPIDGDEYGLRISVTDEGFYWSDVIFATYIGPRILEDDIVEFVASVQGLITYETVFGQSVTVPELVVLDLRLAGTPAATLVTPTPVALPTADGNVQSTPTPVAFPSPTVSTGLPSPSATPVVTPTNTATLTPSPVPGFSRSRPAPPGSVVTFTVEDFGIEISITDVVRGESAWAMIHEANMFNDEPVDGNEYVLVELTASVVAAQSSDDSFTLNSYYADLISQSGAVYDTPFVVEPDPSFDGELYLGGTRSGWIAFEVAISDSHPLVRYRGSFGGDPIWLGLTP